MRTIKNILSCIGLTLLIWVIARVVPSTISVINPNLSILVLLFYLGLLYIGWLISENISKGKHPKCIKINLYIFAVLEISGTIDAVSKLFVELPMYSDLYHFDAYGVAYSDYPFIYGTVLLFGIAYIVMCFSLAKKTNAVIISNPAPSVPFPVEKNHEEKQKLCDEIVKLKSTLKELDETYESNKKILADAFTDEELEHMVENGEFPADKVSEYVETRKALAMSINMHPYIREQTDKMIVDITRQLAELECQVQ